MLSLVRLAAEINIKSPRVKAAFLRRLRANLKAALTDGGHRFTVEGDWARIFIKSDDPTVTDTAARVFGLSSVSPVDFTTNPTIAAMCEAAQNHYAEILKGKTFCVRAKRHSRVGGFTSVEAERLIGAALFPLARGVVMKRPDVLVEVEIRPEAAYFFTRRIPAPGGLPLGVEGRVLVLLSGGFDSAVAAWLMQKRGCAVDYLFLNLAGAAYERSVLTVAKALETVWSNGAHSHFHILDFAPIAAAIKASVKPAYNQVVLKRMMYKAAEALALALPDRGYAAIITGEAIGQVSSQTLHNLAAIDSATTMAVFRPLITYDKEEIITLARKIGTYALCEHVQEYCALTPKHPVTHASPSRAATATDALDPSLISNAVTSRRSIRLREFEMTEVLSDYLFANEIPEGARIIDLREPHQYQAWHHSDAENLAIEDVLRLPKVGKYLLYCPFGLQSAVAAEKLQKAGYEAYSFRGGSQRLRQLEDA